MSAEPLVKCLSSVVRPHMDAAPSGTTVAPCQSGRRAAEGRSSLLCLLSAGCRYESHGVIGQRRKSAPQRATFAETHGDARVKLELPRPDDSVITPPPRRAYPPLSGRVTTLGLPQPVSSSVDRVESSRQDRDVLTGQRRWLRRRRWRGLKRPIHHRRSSGRDGIESAN